MGFLSDLLDKALHDASQLWVGLFNSLGDTTFYIETGLPDILTGEQMDSLGGFLVSFAVSLVLLKALKKGFWTYILWRDGDPDASIQHTVTNLALAVASALSFPTLYEWYAEVSMWLVKRIALGTFEMLVLDSWIDALNTIVSFGTVIGIFVLIYIIMLFILYLQFLKRSAEGVCYQVGFNPNTKRHVQPIYGKMLAHVVAA